MYNRSILGVGIGLLFSISIMYLGGCSDKNPANAQPLSKSSTIALKTGIKSNQSASSIPIAGGSLELTSAYFNLDKLVIQENSGFDGEQQGNHNDGNNNGSETESSDITVNGPLQFDIVNGDVSIGNVSVYPGIFKKVNVYLSLNSAAPFNGNSIFVTGNFHKSDGTIVPFEIKSQYNSMYETLIANGGITVLTNQTVEIKLSFDLMKLFQNLDLSNAVITNNKIIIDSNNNTNILSVFDANLSQSIDFEDHK